MQSLYPDQFDALMQQVAQIAAVLGRKVRTSGHVPVEATTSAD
jgi:hypothetical protein